MLRSQLPSGDLAEIVERALDLLIAPRMKQRFGVGRKPAAAAPEPGRSADVQPPVAPKSQRETAEATSADVHLALSRPSRHIPAEVRRQVLARDGMQCTFVSTAGKRCERRGDLEFHHEHPFARGGETSVANVRLLCAPHNGLLAERDYGREFMRQRIDDLPRGVRDAAFVWGRTEGDGAGHSLAKLRRECARQTVPPGAAGRNAVRPYVMVAVMSRDNVIAIPTQAQFEPDLELYFRFERFTPMVQNAAISSSSEVS